MFLHLSVILFARAGLCPNMHHRSHDQGGSLSRGLSVCGGCLSWGVCVQGRFCLGVSVQGGLCHGGSQSRGLCGEEGLRQRDPPYGNEQAVCILLECILVLYSL